jgi:alkanesulfonate monooxygenase SsuD/methylene tetrahydromethanopterin reductase-like flavin-dependent oxidoreductase (luciferase family)
MMRIGYFLSSEEWGPRELVAQAEKAKAAPEMPITTAVTCPTIRTHPAVIAQAAATASVMLEGRFHLGVGSGEALNEHIVKGGLKVCWAENAEQARKTVHRLWPNEGLPGEQDAFFTAYGEHVLPRVRR